MFLFRQTCKKSVVKLVTAAISVICSCTNFLQSQSICLLQIIQSSESPVYVLPASTANTFKDTGAMEAHHWSLVDDFADHFDFSGNDYSKRVAEESADPSSCVVVIFQPSFYYLLH